MNHSSLQIAIASGKGGTGKSTVAVHLAERLSQVDSVALLDLDVEAPNLLGYYPSAQMVGEPSAVQIALPVQIREPCENCRRCAESCFFGAITVVRGKVKVDPIICKGCGRCILRCPQGVLEESWVKAGELQRFRTDNFELLRGVMEIGDVRATAVISSALKRAEKELFARWIIRDCPPGTTCPTVRAVHGSHLTILVAEPTPFSLHDLQGAVKMLRSLEIPMALVINKAGMGEVDLKQFAEAQEIPLLGTIPWSLELAQRGAQVKLACGLPAMSEAMEQIVQNLLKLLEQLELERSKAC